MSCHNGFVRIAVWMSVWNLPGNTGSLYLMYLKIPATSLWHTLNTSRQSVVKNGQKRRQMVADLFKHDLVAGSFMPPLKIRQLRDLMRYRFKLTNFLSSEKNRLQNSLTVSNIQLGNVVSDTFGKSSMNIIEKLLKNPLDTTFDIEPLIHGSMKNKLPELELAIDGFITPEQAEKLKVIKQHYEELQSRKADLEKIILSLAASQMACFAVPSFLVVTRSSYFRLAPPLYIPQYYLRAIL